MSALLNITLTAFLPANIAIYRFEENYVEIWYQIPVSQVFSPQELQSAPFDSIFKEYQYRFDIHNNITNDSAQIEGTKGALIRHNQRSEYFIDYIPIFLYPGTFDYRLTFTSAGAASVFEGRIDMSGDTLIISCSDLILGRKNAGESFICHGHAFTPSIDGRYSNSCTLFSFLAIYGIVPDSLYYQSRYTITDRASAVVFEKQRRYLKHDYSQIDTLTISLNDYIEGQYLFSITVTDSSSGSSFSQSKEFRIVTLFDETAGMTFNQDIHYLISRKEFDGFRRLSNHDKKVYLKKFWSKRDYWQFEKRLLEANAKFSTPFLIGSDTEQGRAYINLGPPDWIDYRAMEQTWKHEDLRRTKIGGSRQIWHYDAKGLRLLFCDTDGDGNFELLGALSAKDEWQETLKDLKEIMGYIR